MHAFIAHGLQHCFLLQASSDDDWAVGTEMPVLESLRLEKKATTVLDVRGLGPRQALAALRCVYL